MQEVQRRGLSKILHEVYEMKKALMNASVASMIYKFNMDNIEILESLGYQVDVACNFGKENPITPQEINRFRTILCDKNINVFETDCPRSIFAIGKMVKTYKQLKKIIDEGEYELIHTQSPIGGVVCRFAARKARKKGTKVIYTAHGFHFYKGSPKKNWIFYPIEKACSRLNDLLITINKEDFERAKKFYSKDVKYISGIGVDVSRFLKCKVYREEKRRELGLLQNEIVLLSVGELSARKNHQVVIKALGKIKDKSIKYLIAGMGEDYYSYQSLAAECGISDRVILLGARTDIDELCAAADVFVHPSVREGLGIAPLEGMAAGLPLISSYVNGIKDYTEDGVTGCCIENPLEVDAFANAIKMMLDKNFREKCGRYNINVAYKFSLEASKEKMREIYNAILSTPEM